jgi:hypothetical protein
MQSTTFTQHFTKNRDNTFRVTIRHSIITQSEECRLMDVTPCGTCKNTCFGETYRFHHPVTLMVEAIHSSETQFLTRTTWRQIPVYGIPHSHRLVNLKSYIVLTGWTLWQRRRVLPVRYGLGFYIPEDGILHSYRRKNIKSYITLTG